MLDIAGYRYKLTLAVSVSTIRGAVYGKVEGDY